MLNISKVILMRTDSNLCRKELTVHWSAPNSPIRSYRQPCINSVWEDESEAVAPIIWLYQIVDAQKEEIFFPDLLITLRSYGTRFSHMTINQVFEKSMLSDKSATLKTYIVTTEYICLNEHAFFIFHFFNDKLLEKYHQTPVWQQCDSC